MPFGDFLAACAEATGGDAHFTWIASDALLAAGGGPWMEVPLWLPLPEYAGVQQASIARAVGAGLTFRPLEETIRAALDEADTVDGVGLTPEREAELLGS